MVIKKGNTKMKILRAFLSSLAVVGLIFSVASGATDVERGEKLFKNPKAFGGVKACNTCHPNGRGIEKAGMKSKFYIMGGTQNGLEEAVNACIVKANRGKAIAGDSAEMKDIVAYIKSLGKSGY